MPGTTGSESDQVYTGRMIIQPASQATGGSIQRRNHSVSLPCIGNTRIHFVFENERCEWVVFTFILPCPCRMCLDIFPMNEWILNIASCTGNIREIVEKQTPQDDHLVQPSSRMCSYDGVDAHSFHQVTGTAVLTISMFTCNARSIINQGNISRKHQSIREYTAVGNG